MRPLISLIICTKNRCEQLTTCLNHINEISSKLPWEAIIVDNNSTDQTSLVIQQFICTFPGAAKGVFESKPGNGVGRNTGILLAQGEIIAFTDDDCYVAPDFIDQMWAIFQDKCVGYASGRVLLHDPNDAKITINESPVANLYSSGVCLPVGLIQGANMAFRRVALNQAGLFDPIFGAGAKFAGEDWELAIRVSFCGWSGGYFPGPTVSHHHGRKLADVPKLLRFYAIGEGAVYSKFLRWGPMRFKVLKMFLREFYTALITDQNFSRAKYMVLGMLQYLTAPKLHRGDSP